MIKLKDLNRIKASNFADQLVDKDELMDFVEMVAYQKIDEIQREKIRCFTEKFADLAIEVSELADKYPGNWILEENATVLGCIGCLLAFRVLAVA